MRVRGTPVEEHEDGSIVFTAGMTIDGDGSPRCYAPHGMHALDDLDNAGHPGNWYGILTNRVGEPIVQSHDDPYPGFYVSPTKYRIPGHDYRDPRGYLDSEKVRFIVVPGTLARMVPGIVIGCKATVTRLSDRRTVSAVVGDIGPSTHLGEASIALATRLGVPSDPRTGGTDDPHFVYRFWPGVAAEGFVLQPL